MKKLVCLVCAFMMLAAVAVAEIDLGSMTSEELVALRDQIGVELAKRDAAARSEGAVAVYQSERGLITLTDYEIIEEKGKRLLAFTFTFENNTKENQSFTMAYWAKVYQGGIQLESGYRSEKNVPNTFTDMMPGAVLAGFRQFYELRDESPTVTVTIYNGLSFSNENPMTFELPLGE